MKLQQVNNDQLEVYESGKLALVIGAAFSLGGIGLALWTLSQLQTTPWWVSLIGLGVTGIGALVVFSAASHKVVLRRSGISEITDQKLISKKVASRQFDASQVAAVGLETRIEVSTEQSDKGTTTKRERVSVLFITLTDSTEVVVAQERSGAGGVALGGVNVSSFGAAPLAAEAKQVADLYGVQLQSRTDGAMGGVESLASAIGVVKQAMAAAEPATPGVAPLVQTSTSAGSADPAPFSTPQVQPGASQMVVNPVVTQAPAMAAVQQPVIYQSQAVAAPVSQPTPVSPSYTQQPTADPYQAPSATQPDATQGYEPPRQ